MLTIKKRECLKRVDRNNHEMLPKSIRGLICAKSSGGKSTVMLNLLTNPGWLDYDNLIIYGKALFQPEYQVLKKAFDAKLPKEHIDSLFDHVKEIQSYHDHGVDAVINALASTIRKNDKSDISVQYFDSDAEIPDPSELDPCKKNLIVFDDVQMENQKKCEAYYTRGRHSSVDCFYLAQNYFKVPRQTIRENSNLIILFRQANKSISDLYRDHASLDMSYADFKKLCSMAWSKSYGFLTIDLTREPSDGKYRINLDTIVPY